MNIKNILFDRDGTLIEDGHYISRPEQVFLFSYTGPVLQNLQARGYRLFLVTNQSGIGRGFLSEQDYQQVHHQMVKQLGAFSVQFTDHIHCPHTPGDKCTCRKPRPGMWQALASRHGLKAEETIIIGDKMSDIQFAHQANLLASILVLTGKGPEEASRYGLPDQVNTWLRLDTDQFLGPDVIAQDLRLALFWIISQEPERHPQ